MERTVGHVTRITRLGIAAIGPTGAVPRAAARTGTVTASTVRPKGPTAPLLALPGRARVVGAPAYQGDVVIDATGKLAPGLAADELGGLIGASSAVGAHPELRLTNTDDVAALVDIVMFGPSGVVTARNATGLAVAAHSTRVIPLETLAPAQELLLVNVRARSGRVAVALRQQMQSASTPRGMDWLPLAQPPARTTIVPGLTAGLGPRRIMLGNPGDIDATASIRLIRTDSSFVPRGVATVTVPAGSVVSVDITNALGTKAGAALISADHPVVSGALMSTGPRVSGYAERAYSASTPSLSGSTPVVVNYARGRTSALLLTAPTRAADVQVTTLGGVGPGAGYHVNVHIPAGRTVSYDLTAIAHGELLVAVNVAPLSGSAPVYAARDEVEFGAHGPMFTVLPIVTAPQVTVIPPAALDLRAGVPQ